MGLKMGGNLSSFSPVRVFVEQMCKCKSGVKVCDGKRLRVKIRSSDCGLVIRVI